MSAPMPTLAARRLESVSCRFRYSPRASAPGVTRGVAEIINAAGVPIVKAAGVDEAAAMAAAITAFDLLSITSAADANALAAASEPV